MADALTLYGDSRSGNCYKLKLLCAEMGRQYRWQEVDILAGDTRTPEFLAMNANGKIPLARLPSGRYLAESNAIMSYLAEGTPLSGSDRYGRAEVLQWLFFEQYSHEPNIATSRFIIQFLGSPADRQAALVEKHEAGLKALAVMEEHLEDRDYVADGRFTIADIGLYAYTHVANEGGFDLAPFPAVTRWLQRVAARPAHVPMSAGSEA